MLYLDLSLIKKINNNKTKNIIKTWKRSSVITESFIGNVISIHNGKNFINVLITNKMLGRKLGEFSLTRKYPKHPVKDKNVHRKKKVKK